MHRLPSEDAWIKTDEFNLRHILNDFVYNICAARIVRGKFLSDFPKPKVINLPRHQLDPASYLVFLVLRNQLAERNQPERKTNLLAMLT